MSLFSSVLKLLKSNFSHKVRRQDFSENSRISEKPEFFKSKISNRHFFDLHILDYARFIPFQEIKITLFYLDQQ